MSYLTTIEHQLRKLVNDVPAEYLADDLVAYVRGKLVESFNNGLQAAARRKVFRKQKTTA